MEFFRQLVHLWILSWCCRVESYWHDGRDPQAAFSLFNWSFHFGKHVRGLMTNMTECPPLVIFVLDGSDSVSPNNYRMAKTSLTREIQSLTQTFADTDMGVILFSDVIQDLPLGQREGSQVSDLIRQVQSLRQPRKKTSLAAALKRARESLLENSHSESRAYNGYSRGHIIVLFSDGFPDNWRETLQEAKLALEEDIHIISLSLGDSNHLLLRDISHHVQDHRQAINWTSLAACPARVLNPVPRGSQCRDFLLVVDGSDSVLRHKETVRQYLAYTALRYRFVNNSIGVTVYGTDPDVQASNTRIRLQADKRKLAEAIRLKLRFPTSGGTGTDKAITQSLTMLREDASDRQAALIVITDGPSLDPQATRDAVQRARSSGHEVVIIRVGNAMPDEELNFIIGGE
ncbi:unnamed protein product, partial [Candidula unifasciata]